jgi:hypothetical protein
VIPPCPISEVKITARGILQLEKYPIQEPNGGPSPIPYGFEGRTGIVMGTMTGEVIVD